MTVYALQGWRPPSQYYSLGEFSSAQHGQSGCWTGSGFTTNINANFSPISQGQLLEKEKRIYQLQEDIKDFKRNTEKSGQKAMSLYQDYLSVKLPVCGMSVTDYLRIWGKSDYSECLEERDALREPLIKANLEMNKMTSSRIQFNVKFAELLSYAPSQQAWRELCSRKKDVDRSFQDLSEEVVDLAEKSLKKVMKEESEQEEANKVIDRMLGLFKALLSALEALINTIVNVFAAVLQGLSGFAKFLAKHPWAIPVVGGVAVLGVGTFVLRPYITALNFLRR